MKYSRTQLGSNIAFSSVIDEKFKTSYLTVRLITKLSPELSAQNAMGMGVLSSSNSEYRTLAEINEKLSSLYGASLTTFASKRGDVQILGLSSSWITNRYAIDGENIEGDMLSVIEKCLFSPNAENGEFNAESFRITKKEILDRIDAELNNKRGYALARALQVAFKGEPAENSCYGTKEEAEKVTAKSAYSAYRKLLENAQAEIYYVAPQENPEIPEMIKRGFSEVQRNSGSVQFRSVSKAKDSIATESDEFDVRQCKMVMTFKTTSDDIFATKILSTIFGETPFSKLFLNVREKMSLCYYCACRSLSYKGALMVDCGVERENIEKAKNEILNQLDEIRKGNISDEELSNAVLYLDNGLSQVGDTPSSYASWYFERFCDGNIRTPQEILDEYRKVTKERITEASKALTLDSMYIMYNKEDKE